MGFLTTRDTKAQRNQGLLLIFPLCLRGFVVRRDNQDWLSYGSTSI